MKTMILFFKKRKAEYDTIPLLHKFPFFDLLSYTLRVFLASLHPKPDLRINGPNKAGKRKKSLFQPVKL